MTEINLKAKITKYFRLMFEKECLRLTNFPYDNKERARIKFTPAIQYKLVEINKNRNK